MKKTIPILIVMLAFGCAGPQTAAPAIEARSMDETNAFAIIDDVLSQRPYSAMTDVDVQLENKVVIKADYRSLNHAFAIEYLTKADTISIGRLPAKGTGSKLHVIPVTDVSKRSPSRGESLYLLLVDSRNYKYQVNPNPNQRVFTTIKEVQARLKRDLSDFIHWFESTVSKDR